MVCAGDSKQADKLLKMNAFATSMNVRESFPRFNRVFSYVMCNIDFL